MAVGASPSRITRTHVSRTAGESSPFANNCKITRSPYLSTTRPGSSSASLKHRRQESVVAGSFFRRGKRRSIEARSRAASSSSHADSSIASRASLEVAERNLDANRGQLGAEVDWVQGDAFEILREWSGAGETFDTIVLDPPAFAKSQRAVEGALRGYKELNLRALKMLRPRGLLITCTCSHHVSWAEFEGTVASAAADANRRVRLHDRRGAAPDHPVILNLAETEYLKCLVLEVE